MRKYKPLLFHEKSAGQRLDTLRKRRDREGPKSGSLRPYEGWGTVEGGRQKLKADDTSLSFFRGLSYQPSVTNLFWLAEPPADKDTEVRAGGRGGRKNT